MNKMLIMKVKIDCFLISLMNCTGILKMMLNLKITFGRMDIFTILRSPINKYERPFCLLVHSSTSVFQWLRAFIVQVTGLAFTQTELT